MKNFISTDSKLYAGRLIREIRDRWQAGHGVYYCPPQRPSELANPRINSVRFNTKRHCIIAESNVGQFLIYPANWNCFVDNASGKEIYASRQSK
jgi:hypothetical protein